MGEYDDVCVLVPTYNEAETVEEVVTGMREEGFDHVLVVDGHSTDGTRALARDAGAEVITQTEGGRGSGKGQAVRDGVAYTDRPYILMLDGDGTYRPEDAHAMVEPVIEGRADHVVGDRFADMEAGAMPKLNQFGNGMINHGFAAIHGQHLADILSGYRAFTRESFREMNLNADGFGIETEMAVEARRNGQRVQVVDVSYISRPDASESNLRPFRDGGVILLTLYLRAKTHNPLFYFGSVGGVFALLGTVIGFYVLYDWFVNRISHEVLAPAGGFIFILGVQFLIFGVLADLLVSLHEEQRQRLERIARRDPSETRRPGAHEHDVDDALRDDAPEERPASTTDGSTAKPSENRPNDD
ncbi:S-layer glycoprotein N-glycosyltransferase AglJ [Halorubellus sp. JP-L1]|uniref:S-layer glycoprotein N-glycosyltransferase AglJ n=1 Tax=Halorubellus sp. JP-L1 TaxID=2715753 RepID=UPI00140AD210|nr:S-layer glycoprotein N-glycosyltransferase AglJ [Halorubellus sp. JP-L1]NHN40922.1 S-layer glycoprotein N-glycosyltransferase AglJ [Halorubellus sp. JP-L1]